jgi:uncharacterized membrane protein (UPF0127 family)
VRDAWLRFERTTLYVEVPETRRERRRGLLGMTPLKRDGGMLFLRCRSVHTFGMPAPIAVAELDAGLRVLRIRVVPPGRLVLPNPRTRHILECGEGAEIAPGDRAELRLAPDEAEQHHPEEAHRDRADQRRGDDHEREDPTDGARERDGLSASLGSSKAEELEHRAHGVPSAHGEPPLSEGDGGPPLYFRG